MHDLQVIKRINSADQAVVNGTVANSRLSQSIRANRDRKADAQRKRAEAANAELASRTGPY